MIEIKRIDQVYQCLKKKTEKTEEPKALSAAEIAAELEADRANVSRYLNKLFKEDKLIKIKGRPVLYKIKIKKNNKKISALETKKNLKTNKVQANKLDQIIGAKKSLKNQIQQAKAAILYPPNGLHTLLLGETGVGKSMFASLMHDFAIAAEMLKKDAPFIQFNCADYVDNPQLLIAQIFGVKKGAYTGANQNREGLLKQADQGILFLDEIHRLPPQGQEMLFTFIDNGYFRPLGESENKLKAEVQIIAATTENPNSFLLNTFIRRIPMVIKLPALKNRSLAERFRLLENFLKEESKNIGNSIYINRKALISFLLYDCPNNIGQLASDIQLASAKSFLNYKTSNNKYILIAQSDIPEHVQKGILNLHNQREKIDNLFKDQSDILEFSAKEKNKMVNINSEKENENTKVKLNKVFYDVIENKLKSLRNKNMDEDQIQQILNIDIESHFKKHLESLPNIINKSDINKIVNKEIVEITESILKFSTRKLKRSFNKKIFLALALHLQKSIERIKAGEKIYHPELNNIRINHFQEFMTAMEAASLIDQKFNLETPLDEIGYISMFLIENPYQINDQPKAKVAVFILMHGKSTASSMAEVANKLLGEEIAVGIDMPLEMQAQSFFTSSSKQIKKIADYKDILLLVDMGSLTSFADMIELKQEQEIEIISMVSTATVIDACRKAILGQSLEQIYNSCLHSQIQTQKSKLKANPKISKEEFKLEAENDKNLIITACFTGAGASSKLKEIIENQYSQLKIKIISLNIINYNKFIKKIKSYQKEYNLLAIISTIDLKEADLPFIPALEVLSGKAFKKIDSKIENLAKYNKINNSLAKHLENLNSKKIINEVKNIIESIINESKIEIDSDVKIGVLLHLVFLIEKLLKGEKPKEFKNLAAYKAKNSFFMEKIKEKLYFLEKEYAVQITEAEIAYLTESLLNNSKQQTEIELN
ncbi:MAG: sigma 54-interacting transcriptional regulator [Bacillota bacterium]